VRPYLSSHGGDVRLLGIDNSVVRLAFFGQLPQLPVLGGDPRACGAGCGARRGEIRSVEAVAMQAGPVIPADALLSRVRTDRHQPTTWCAAPELDGLRPGEVAGFVAGDTAVLACRVEDAVLATSTAVLIAPVRWPGLR
jgi:hypothetical protein